MAKVTAADLKKEIAELQAELKAANATIKSFERQLNEMSAERQQALTAQQVAEAKAAKSHTRLEQLTEELRRVGIERDKFAVLFARLTWSTEE